MHRKHLFLPLLLVLCSCESSPSSSPDQNMSDWLVDDGSSPHNMEDLPFSRGVKTAEKPQKPKLKNVEVFGRSVSGQETAKEQSAAVVPEEKTELERTRSRAALELLRRESNEKEKTSD